MCEVLHTRWKAKLLGSLEGGKRARPKGGKAMMDVATALVESSLAETFLVIIVALFAVLVFGVVVAIDARWRPRDAGGQSERSRLREIRTSELAHRARHMREAGM